MCCLLSVDWTALLAGVRPSPAAIEWGSSAAGAFALVAAAEMGDKSQLVCMTLAARQRALPVLFGATLAFSLLNLAAVSFGAAVARWLPPSLLGAAVALLFAGFGLRALLAREKEDDGETPLKKGGRGVFVSAFVLIFVAEFGDKTQLTVAGMSAALPPLPVWLGGTLALAGTSALGVFAGRVLLRRMPVHWLHRVSGVLFLIFAAFAAWRLAADGVFSGFWEALRSVVAAMGHV